MRQMIWIQEFTVLDIFRSAFRLPHDDKIVNLKSHSENNVVSYRSSTQILRTVQKNTNSNWNSCLKTGFYTTLPDCGPGAGFSSFSNFNRWCPASSGKEKTKCDRIAPSHPLSWPCVSDLHTTTSKARAATRCRNPRWLDSTTQN